MTVTSAQVNKVLRAVLEPALRDLGFSKHSSRHYWRYLPDSVWALHIRAVGNYFSSVTGFPPASLIAELGTYYLDFPTGSPAAIDTDGLPIPRITECHVRLALVTQRGQSALRPVSMAPPERARTDIWWVSSDGSNLTEVVDDIRDSVLRFGVPFLEKPYNNRAEQLRRRGLVRPGVA